MFYASKPGKIAFSLFRGTLDELVHVRVRSECRGFQFSNMQNENAVRSHVAA